MEIINIIKEIVNGLNLCQKEDLKIKGYTNSCFFNGEELTPQYTFNVLEKKKYFYLNCHGSGVFLIDREGEIYNIKGYGVADLNKKQKANLGNIKDYVKDGEGIIFDKIKWLFARQYNYLR